MSKTNEKVICVDRSVDLIPSSYPIMGNLGIKNRRARPLHPDFEKQGPNSFHLNTIEQWFHPNQQKDCLRGYAIYRYLKRHNLLERCLGVRDLLAIKESMKSRTDLEIYDGCFGISTIFAWKGVAQDPHGRLFVPCLKKHNRDIRVWWDFLHDYSWHRSSPALLFGQ